MERLWRTVKYEEVYLKAYSNGREARTGLDAYFSFYNTQRPHQALDYRTPGEVFNGQRGQLLERSRLPKRTLIDYAETAGLSLNIAQNLSQHGGFQIVASSELYDKSQNRSFYSAPYRSGSILK